VKATADKAWRAAFEARLAVVVREKGITVPAGGEAEFVDGAERAYKWLATVRRTAEVDRTRYLSHWLDEVSAARFGAVRPSELLTAAYAHGDIVAENGGEVWNVYLGINPYVGRDAQSVPLTGGLMTSAS
jgi:hypothetical protein